MAKNSSVANELKSLGLELAQALKHMKDSKEFKSLESEISSSVKKVSASLFKSLDAARKSQDAAVLKKRVGKVVRISAKKGGEEASKAQAAALARLKKFSQAFQKLAKKHDE